MYGLLRNVPAFNVSLALLVSPAVTIADVNSDSLLRAAQQGNLAQVNALISNRADVNARTEDATALMLASGKGFHQVLQALLAAQADVNAKSNRGNTALVLAIAGRHLQVVQTLLEAKADVNPTTPDGVTPLLVASFGQLEVVRLLLGAGADVNRKGKTGFTALMVASLQGQSQIVKDLLAAGAEVDAKNTSGETAHTLASRNGHKEVAQILSQAQRQTQAQARNKQASPGESPFGQCSVLHTTERLFISASDLRDKYGWNGRITPDGQQIVFVQFKMISESTGGLNAKQQNVWEGQYFFDNLGIDGKSITDGNGTTLEPNTKLYYHCASK